MSQQPRALGFGLGLRGCHFADVLSLEPGPEAAVDWFEIISENFLDGSGWPNYALDQIAERFPIVMHGVSLGIGGPDPLDRDYLVKLAALAKRTGACWVSDHLCWTALGGHNSHDLLPLPYDEESLRHLVSRVLAVQDQLERPLVLENPSRYLSFASDTFSEADFLATLVAETGCKLLVDVNNIYVSSVNLGFDPSLWIDAIPADAIVQVHLAGPARGGAGLIDTHDNPVAEPVWPLFEQVWQRTGGVSTLLEWDSSIPSFKSLIDELNEARATAAGRPRSRAPYDPMSVTAAASASDNDSPVLSTPVHHLVDSPI